MAAPSGIVWGSTVGGYGRIGIYTKVTAADASSEAKLNVEIWFWSKYTVDDANNTLYYNNLTSTGSATSSQGSKSIKTTVNTGSGWSTTNQVRLASYETKYTRGTSASTRYLYAKLENVDRVGGTMYANVTVTIPALFRYTIIYHGNAADATNVPDNTYKYYGQNANLSTTKPTRTGYTFSKWNTAQDGKGTSYSSGALYTTNASDVLYAIWTAGAYTITFNDNGGSKGPGTQTKTHGVDFIIPATVPTRTNYTFKGWGTSSDTSKVSYSPGSKITSNSNLTLYAIWELGYTKPRITNFEAYRSDTSGNRTDAGKNIRVYFNWATDNTVTSIKTEVKKTSDSTWVSYELVNLADWLSGTSGYFSYLLMYTTKSNPSTEDYYNSIDIERSYDYRITVADANGSSVVQGVISSMILPIDVKPPINGKEIGVAIGKTAETHGLFDVGLTMLARKGIRYAMLPKDTDFDEVKIPGAYPFGAASTYNYDNCPIDSATSGLLEVFENGDDTQRLQRITACSKSIIQVWQRCGHDNSTPYWGSWTRCDRIDAVTATLNTEDTKVADGETIVNLDGHIKSHKDSKLTFEAFTDVSGTTYRGIKIDPNIDVIEISACGMINNASATSGTAKNLIIKLYQKIPASNAEGWSTIGVSMNSSWSTVKANMELTIPPKILNVGIATNGLERYVTLHWHASKGDKLAGVSTRTYLTVKEL